MTWPDVFWLFIYSLATVGLSTIFVLGFIGWWGERRRRRDS